jgi:hypothetical protein
MSMNSSPLDDADRARWNVVELLIAIRLLGGALLASLAASAVLYAPDQVHELYRITASDRDQDLITREIVLGLGSLTAMAVVFYWVSIQIVIQCGHKIARDARVARGVLTVMPILIGALPLVASGLGMLAARPQAITTKLSIGSPWEGRAQQVTDTLNTGLQQGAAAMFFLAGMLVAVGILFAYHGRRNGTIDDVAQRRGTAFFSMLGLVVSIGIVLAMTIATMYSPVALPRYTGTLTIVATFFIAIMLMTGQMSVWQETTGIPFVIVLAALAIGFAALDLNDNHEIRALKPTDTQLAAPPEQLARLPPTTWQSFQAWYKARPDRDQYKDTYPIYIVAAQGGGIYAAYHTATLLARIQDLCPRFNHHLFAISSVSGGSLGAGVFAAVTKGLDAAARAPAVPPTKESTPVVKAPANQHDACPQAEKLARSTEPNPALDPKEHRHETATRAILETDFLSPLAAATLFPDFTQRFLPVPVPAFDRARWLEASFEESWQAARIPGPNPLQQSTLRMWSPDGVAPALLINTTESDSGRRQLIAPFRINELNAKGELLQFPLWNIWDPRGEGAGPRWLFPNPGHPCKGRDIPLSTAIGLSARFPWLTPAGSLTTDCNDEHKPIKTRVVDGGYFDNSGVDTAIDVITLLSSELAKTNFKLDGPDGPRIEIHLVVLTTSDYPKRAGYGLGDGLEPIRALLSTRTARTPIAINQAKRRLEVLQKVAEIDTTNRINVQLPHIHEAGFRDTFFRIPLGWRLSKPSRDVIDTQSGRFLDCDANENHKQSDKELSNADCIQLMIYHQLDGSMPERLKVVELGLRYANSGLRTEMPPFNMDNFVRCYASELTKPGADGKRDRVLQPRHRRSIEGILQAWSRGNSDRDNDEWLAFALAVADWAGGSLPLRYARCLSENCVRREVERLDPVQRMLFGRRARLEADDNGNSFYERGYIQLADADNYRALAQIMDSPIDRNPDLLLVPVISARALITWLTDPRINPDGNLAKFTTASADGKVLLDAEQALRAAVSKIIGDQIPSALQPYVKSMLSGATNSAVAQARERILRTNRIAKACIANARNAGPKQ